MPHPSFEVGEVVHGRFLCSLEAQQRRTLPNDEWVSLTDPIRVDTQQEHQTLLVVKGFV